jgi:citrate lyase subunit beta/citryl-CoA lyase
MLGLATAISCIAPLFVPATRPDRFRKAAESGSDAIIIDLEDAVAAVDKVSARDALPGNVPSSVPVIVRINARGTEWFEDDIMCVRQVGAICVMIPKAESEDDILSLKKALPGVSVVAIIESAKGLVNARRIAAAGASRLAFGSLDFSVDLGCAHEPEALLSARSEIVLASRLADLNGPLDGVTAAVDDDQAVANDARRAYAHGFGGKMCVHPSQIATVMTAFGPSPSEIAWAKSVIGKSDGGAAKVSGMMVDTAVILRARQILARSSRP